MIQRNTFNPVPLWQGKEQWWTKRKTYKGECRPVMIPTGKVPGWQLSTDGMELIASGYQGGANTIYIVGAADNPKFTGSFNARTVDALTMSDLETKRFSKNGSILTFKIIDGKYHVEVSEPSDEPPFTKGYYASDKGDLTNQSQLGISPIGTTDHTDMYLYTSDDEGTLTLYDVVHFHGWCSFASSATVTVNVYLCETDELIGGQNVTASVIETPYIPNHITRLAIVVPGFGITTSLSGRMVYAKVSVSGAEYVSEPWQWVKTDELLHIRYGNPTPVIASGNYMPFGSYMTHDIYVNAYLMNPPYIFNDEVEELDGHKFVLKKVSYMQSTFNFFANGYFADVMRMVWSCANVRIEDSVHGWDVEYMEAPEVDWGNSNHLAHITITFQSDTIVQHNGDIVIAE